MNIDSLENNKGLIEICLKKLREIIGPGLSLHMDRSAVQGPDFYVEIKTKPLLRLAVEVKKRITTRSQALHIILQFQDKPGPYTGAMVFADWVPEPVAEELRKAGIFFVDAQGNAFIRKPPQIVVDLRGKKPERSLKAEPGRLIEPAGLKVIHYLLTHPQTLGNPLRMIVKGAGVALGTVHAVMKELQYGQWILPVAYSGVPLPLRRLESGLPSKKEGRRFGNLKGMIELFVRGYALKLRPACLLGRYRHKTRAPREILNGFTKRLAGLEGHWAITGGMAARELTHYLKPATATLFVDPQARAKLEGEPMLRDEIGGNVTLLSLFGAAVLADEPQKIGPLATPLLIYAELLETGGEREVEAARMIYESFFGSYPR